MGTNYYVTRNRPTVESPIHIGKSSIGWMFLFETQNKPFLEPPVVWNSYSELIKWLTEYVEKQKEYVIIDEYDQLYSLEEFVDLVKSKQKEKNPDNFVYAKNVDGYRFVDDEFC